MLLAVLLACDTTTEPPLTGTDTVPDSSEDAGRELAELFVSIEGFQEDCEQGLVALEVAVTNAGDIDAAAGVDVQVYSMPDHALVASSVTLAPLVPGEPAEVVVIEVDITSIGPSGLMVEIDVDDTIEEHDLLPNAAAWDHWCCPEEEPESLGEIWGVATANNGNYDGLAGDHAAYGLRPGGAVWRLNLDTMQPEIVRTFDPVVDEIWYLGGLALHPTEPIVYITGFHYEGGLGYSESDWLDGWDTLIAIDTDSYQTIGQWDLEPDFYSFTGFASDFVDGQDGFFSPGGLQFIDGELYAVEGMTVHHSDLIHIDMTSGSPVLTNASVAYAENYWGGGVTTDAAGVHYATCNLVPVSNVDGDGNELAWVPEPASWIEYDMAGENTCDDPLFTFELDRVHGVTLDGSDTRYAARSTRTYWYDEADAPDFAEVDLNLYTVEDSGAMVPFFDLTNILGTAAAPIDGIANIGWRSL